MVVVPVIGAGAGFTVIGFVAVQPAGVVYVITDEPPVVPTGVTTVVDAGPATTDVAPLLLLHVPPVAALLSVIAEP